MTHQIIQNIEKGYINNKMPVLRAGYQVRVHQKIKEGEKERIQVFEGLVISINAGAGSSKTFTVRKVVEGIGVEKIFPIYSPRIAKIEIKKTLKIRRAKLNFLKTKEGMSKRLSAKLGLLERDEKLRKSKETADVVAEVEEEKADTSVVEPDNPAGEVNQVEQVKEEVTSEAESPVEEKKEKNEEEKTSA
jgi:large subunit ribosomal protein L19